MMPPCLRLLARYTGIASGNDRDLSAAYHAALALAENPPASEHDCDPTYKAVTQLVPDAEACHEQLRAFIRSTLPDYSERETKNHLLETIEAERTDAAFLLGFSYAYVLMTTLSRSDGAR